MNIDRLELELRHHPDRNFVAYLIGGLRDGFYIFKGEQVNLDYTYECRNLQSAKDRPDIVDELLKTEIQTGFLRGPFEQWNFQNTELAHLRLSYRKIPQEEEINFGFIVSA